MLVAHLSKDGNSYESFAASIGVHDDTLREWEKKHPEFLEAKKIAFCHAVTYWEKVLKTAIFNRKVNPTPLIFLMKARFRKFGYLPDSTPPSDDSGFDFDYGDD